MSAEQAIPLPTPPPPTSSDIPVPDAPPPLASEPPDPFADDKLLSVIKQAEADAKAAEKLAAAPAAADKPAEPAPPKEPEKPKEPVQEPQKDPVLKFKAEAPPAPPEIDEIPDDARVPQSSAEWKRFREAHNRNKALLKDRDAKLQQWEARKQELEQLDTLRAERDELVSRFKEFAVVNDPALTKEYDDATDATVQAAKENLGDEAMANTLATIAKLPSGKYRQEQLKAFLEGVDDWQRPMITSYLAELTKINVQRDRKVQEARDNKDRFLQAKAEQEQQARSRRRDMLSRTFEAVVNEVKQRPGYKDIFEDKGFADSWIAESKQTYFGENDPNLTEQQQAQKLAIKALRAELAEPLLQHAITREKDVAERDAKIAELQAVVDKLRGTTPAPNTMGIPGTSPTSDDPFIEGLAKAFNM